MMKLIRLCLLFLFFAIQASFAHAGNFTWIYGFDTLDNQATVARLQTLNIQGVFLSTSPTKLQPSGTSPDAAYTAKVSDFIQRARAVGIDVHAMTLQSNTYFLTERHAEAEQQISMVLAYNRNVSSNQRFGGIHIDTEPHTYQAWQDAKAVNDWQTIELLMQQYVALITRLNQVIKAETIPVNFSAAIHWKYNEWALQGLLPSGRATILGTWLDTLVPMVYETNSSATIYTRSADEVAADNTIVGIRASDFTSYTQLNSVMNSLNQSFAGNANFKGLSIYKFDTLSAMAP